MRTTTIKLAGNTFAAKSLADMEVNRLLEIFRKQTSFQNLQQNKQRVNLVGGPFDGAHVTLTTQFGIETVEIFVPPRVVVPPRDREKPSEQPPQDERQKRQERRIRYVPAILGGVLSATGAYTAKGVLVFEAGEWGDPSTALYYQLPTVLQKAERILTSKDRYLPALETPFFASPTKTMRLLRPSYSAPSWSDSYYVPPEQIVYSAAIEGTLAELFRRSHTTYAPGGFLVPVWWVNSPNGISYSGTGVAAYGTCLSIDSRILQAESTERYEITGFSYFDPEFDDGIIAYDAHAEACLSLKEKHCTPEYGYITEDDYGWFPFRDYLLATSSRTWTYIEWVEGRLVDTTFEDGIAMGCTSSPWYAQDAKITGEWGEYEAAATADGGAALLSDHTTTSVEYGVVDSDIIRQITESFVEDVHAEAWAVDQKTSAGIVVQHIEDLSSTFAREPTINPGASEYQVFKDEIVTGTNPDSSEYELYWYSVSDSLSSGINYTFADSGATTPKNTYTWKVSVSDSIDSPISFSETHADPAPTSSSLSYCWAYDRFGIALFSFWYPLTNFSGASGTARFGLVSRGLSTARDEAPFVLPGEYELQADFPSTLYNYNVIATREIDGEVIVFYGDQIILVEIEEFKVETTDA